MKKILAGLLSLVFVLTLAVPVGAEANDTISFEHEETTLSYTITKEAVGDEPGEVEVGKNSNVSGDVSIPETVSYGGKTYTVTGIGYGAFYECANLASINFPESLTSIGQGAFFYCTSLQKVTLPNSITSIGMSAFSDCHYLESVTLPSALTEIECATFYGCGYLQKIEIPDGVTSIGKHAFYNCGLSGKIEIPGSVTSIGKQAFFNCDGLTALTFTGTEPPSFDKLAFDSCDNLKTITLTADMTEEQRAAWRRALIGLELKDAYVVSEDMIDFTGNLLSSAPETPTTPPADTAAEPAAHTVQQMEQAERPDPMDVEANERYNFWMGVKADLRAAADGKALRVHVPADYTNMPASVMETIRIQNKNITVDLRWGGEQLTITPETAVKKPALKAFWTFSQLCERYAQ